jgi:hypothetical protein
MSSDLNMARMSVSRYLIDETADEGMVEWRNAVGQ